MNCESSTVYIRESSIFTRYVREDKSTKKECIYLTTIYCVSLLCAFKFIVVLVSILDELNVYKMNIFNVCFNVCFNIKSVSFRSI